MLGMKNIINTISRLILIILGATALNSCNDYLDVMPDNRTELDTPEKIKQLLVRAYPSCLPAFMHEFMSDNMTDNGEENGGENDVYLFHHWGYIYQDSPYRLWTDNYMNIANANHALEALDDLPEDETTLALRGEALLCRAFGHFIIANAFCQAYNLETSDTDLGIPYVTKPETTVYVEYERGTVAEVYAGIAADIEEGFALLNDKIYTQPKYHFTRKAAAAFAQQFYLYYLDYERSVEYGDLVLGNDPSSNLRDWSKYRGTSAKEYTQTYNTSEESANILCIGYASWLGRNLGGRYCHTAALRDETMRSDGPWSGELDSYNNIWGYGNKAYFFPKISEYFLVTDQSSGTGHGFIIMVYYSTEKALINRAEALAMLGEYDAAAADLNLFYKQGGGSQCNNTAKQIADWYGESTQRQHIMPMAPRFPLQEGMQKNMVRACLHARRIVALHEGTRMEDLKRYGMSYTHVVDKQSDINLQAYDKRYAIQLPDAIIGAGITPNPR